MPLSKDDVSGIETVAHYTHDEDQAYLMLYGAPRFPAALPGGWENETGAWRLRTAKRGRCVEAP